MTIRFYGEPFGNFGAIQRIIIETGKFTVVKDGADYVVTSHHREHDRNKGAKNIHVGHGVGSLSHFKQHDLPYIFCITGEYFRQFYPEAELLNIGFPQSVYFLGADPEGRRQFLEQRNQDPDRKTILYAPTWDHDEDRGFFAVRFGQPNEVERFCEYITEVQNCNLLVRFHERTRYKEDWLKIHSEIFNEYGVHAIYYPDDPDDTPYIRYSDILVGDMSSINTSFYVADKPVVLIGTDIYKTKRENCNGVTQWDRSNAGFVTDDFDNLLTMIGDSLEYPNRYQFGRKVFVKKYIDYVGEASRQAVINEFSRIILK